MRFICNAILIFFIITLTSCKNEHENHQAMSESYYTCPMHPSVISDQPGACPVCNMSLIKVEKKESEHKGNSKGNFISIDPHKQELAGIKTDSVKYRDIVSVSNVIGTIAIDEEKVKSISSRVKGRIEELFIKTTGITIKKGMPLYRIYSEELQADEKEYLSIIEKNSKTKSKFNEALIDAAKTKLKLWGLTENQLAELEKSAKPRPLITFYSPESGYVTEVKITEGMYVSEGSPLLKLITIDQVWVEVQLYANEIKEFGESKNFMVFTERNPEEVYNGSVVYNNPIIEEGKRIHLIKIKVNNTGGKLIPGTLVSVNPQKSFPHVLAVPKSAVLLEKMKTVWVLAHDNTFEQRMVQTGAENKFWIEITSGLKPGEIVVTDGAYLISSEFILKSGAGQRHNH